MRKSFPKDVLKSIPLRFPNFLKQAKSHDSYAISTCHHTVNVSSYSRIRHHIVLLLEIILGRWISVRIFTKKEKLLKEHFFACFKILYLRILPIKIFSIYLWILFFFFVHTACGTLVPWPGFNPSTPTLEVQSLNHGTPGKSPKVPIFKP